MEIFAPGSPEITADEKEHGDLSRRMAGECMVLLENSGVLPLSEGQEIGLFGSGAAETVKGGTGSGEVNSRFSVSIEQGLRDCGFRITSDSWLERHGELVKKTKEEHIAAVHRFAEEKEFPLLGAAFALPYQEPEPTLIEEEEAKTETAVYVISRNSGEGHDRFAKDGDYLLSENERKNLRLLRAHAGKLVVILNVGGVMDASEILSIGVDALLLMTQLGNLGGLAAADVLSGKVTPSGKLTDTWVKEYRSYPTAATFSHNNGDLDDDDYSDGIYVGYRYFDSKREEVLYPFGFGKSYTTFSCEKGEASLSKEGALRVKALVKNTGDRFSGKEVVQLYVSAPEGALPKPYQELKAFRKTALLSPGEGEELELTADAASLASYSEKEAGWVLEAGDYILRIGSSSIDTVPAAILRVPERILTEQDKNLFRKDREFEEMTLENPGPGELPSDLPVLILSPSMIRTKHAVYTERKEFSTDKTEVLTLPDVRSGKCTAEELVSQLTVEEMANLCVGTFREGDNEIVGNASHSVPGAAGDTSPICLETRGIPNLIMADGPAGLRLQAHFKTRKDGTLISGGQMFGDIVSPFPEDLDPEQVNDYYQYCTAIPIGWALAQSWNLPLIEETADMVGAEMEKFHINLWLAPAMNIHRNPLCGRNFEYYSEDPFVSGKVAAAITKGVQKHKGCGTTIKHFACNNQEENRYFTNVHIGERTMREIYLKGFEIAVKEAQPASVMTSYNLVNGYHTANQMDMLQYALRDEWGFEGAVMTDWSTSQEMPFAPGEKRKYTISASTGCVCTGNDIQMPGCTKNVTDLIDSVTENREIGGWTVTKKDLQYCALHVVQMAARLG